MAEFPLSQTLPDAAAVAVAIGKDKTYTDQQTKGAVVGLLLEKAGKKKVEDKDFGGQVVAMVAASKSFGTEAKARLTPEQYALLDYHLKQESAASVAKGQAKLQGLLEKYPNLAASLAAEPGSKPTNAWWPWAAMGLALVAAAGLWWWRSRSSGLGFAGTWFEDEYRPRILPNYEERTDIHGTPGYTEMAMHCRITDTPTTGRYWLNPRGGYAYVEFEDGRVVPGSFHRFSDGRFSLA